MTEYVSKDDFFINMCKQIKNPSIKSWIGAIISEIPAADVAPVKHGKWVGYQTNSFKNSSEGLKRKFYRCSICHTANAICAKYCPNCGAKMDEEE